MEQEFKYQRIFHYYVAFRGQKWSGLMKIKNLALNEERKG